MFATVDDEDYELVANHKWYCLANGYGARDIWLGKGKKKTVYLHRVILNAQDGEYVDHANRNKLDNRRSNLRICSQVENAWNSKRRKDNNSGYKGVSWDKSRNKWMVRIKMGSAYKFGGYFATAEEGYEKYKEMCFAHRGAFARVA